jgi:formylglycine-generating enzyme required for sulfatase activity
MEALRSLQVDAATFDRNGRDAAFLNHRDERLVQATALAGIESYRKRLGALELDYLAACRTADRLARRRRRRVQTLIYTLFALILVILVGWMNQSYVREQINWFTTMRPYMVTQVRPYVLAPEAERALKPQDVFRECAKECPEMIVIPAGSFVMGSPQSEKGRDGDEGPQRTVTIARPFAVSRFDVTFADWDACVAVGGCRPITDSDMGRGMKPVINVTWDDARQYAAWLSRMTGHLYRLLTEAEWEYAARAGTTTGYYWGDEIGEGNANCKGCDSRTNSRETSPVGSFKPNAFGLYDMAGNVFQWTEDCSHDNYAGAPADGSAWTSGDCSRRIVRGGSWEAAPEALRSASRDKYATNNRDYAQGFRVGRTLSGRLR